MTSDEAWTELQTEQNDPECSFEICRLCMGTESLENLFEGDGLQRWITDYLSIVVSSEDSISHAICTICRIQLDEFHQFRIRCMEVQTALWSMAQTGKIVESPKHSRLSCSSRQQRNMPIEGVLERDGQYHCGTCGKVFDDKKRILDHMRIHDPKKHRCMQCGQSFPIRLHLKSHTCEELEEESTQMEHETFDLQAVKIEPREEIDSIAESPRSEHLLKQETAFEEEGSSYAEEQEESRRVNHIEEATTDRIEIGLVKIKEPADDDMEESAVLLNTELETNADQRDVPFELGLRNAETATSRSNDSMHSKMAEVCEIPKNNVISDETNVRRKGSVKANSEGKTKSPREKPNHRCDQCLKVFSTRLKLKDHMRMVHGEKKYACHICDKRFVLPNNLRVHARSHNEDTPFKCNVCEKTFKYEQSVWQHKKTQHVSQNSCVDCGIDFPSSRYLRLHLMTHISDELEEESPQKEHEMLDLQAVKIEPLGEIDSIAESPRSEHSLEGEKTAFEDEVSSYGEEQEESQTESHTEEATADSIEIGLVKIEEPADDDMEEDAVSQNAELEANADQRDLHFEVGLENAEPATSRSNDSMHSEMEEVCEVAKDINIISDETNVRRKKGTRNVKANSKIEDCGPREDKILEITQKKLQHRCNECSKVFSTSSKLKDHMRLVHGERKLACHICNKRFILPSQLRIHAKKHDRDKPFKCDICGKTFKYGQSLWQHKNIRHGAQNSCADCGIYFPLRRQLEGHLRTKLHQINVEMRANSKNEKVSDESGSNDTTDVTNQRTNEVDNAEEAQPDTAGSAQQQQQQQQQQPKHHQCDTCSKMFWKKRQLDDHTRLVHGEKNFACSMCNKRFIAASRLRSHVRRHDKTKPYKCAKCGKCYKAENTLANHERIQHKSGDSIQMLRKETFNNGGSPSASS